MNGEVSVHAALIGYEYAGHLLRRSLQVALRRHYSSVRVSVQCCGSCFARNKASP